MVNTKNNSYRRLSKSKQKITNRKTKTTNCKKVKRRKNSIKSLKKGGSKNGCGHNQRLVYDAEGLIGCSRPFGTPYQGGQKFVFPNKIKSIV
jgi:hypothetical protein